MGTRVVSFTKNSLAKACATQSRNSKRHHTLAKACRPVRNALEPHETPKERICDATIEKAIGKRRTRCRECARRILSERHAGKPMVLCGRKHSQAISSAMKHGHGKVEDGHGHPIPSSLEWGGSSSYPFKMRQGKTRAPEGSYGFWNDKGRL